MGVFSIFREPGKKSDPAKVKIPSREAYYETIARRISFAKYALILLSVCFAAFAFTFYGDELTIENFRYMLKFVSFDPVTVGSDGSRVVYDYDAGNLGAVVRGDLAVVNKTGISVYDFNSRRVLKSGFSYADPLVRTSDRNVYVCDLGGRELEVFTSYSSVLKQTYEYPILGLDVTDGGAFAVISKKRNYRSGVWVYDENFNTIYTAFFGAGSDDRDREILDVALRGDKNELLAAAFYTTESGEFETCLMRMDLTQEDSYTTQTFTGELPWQVAYCDDGGFWLLTNKALRSFAADGSLLLEELYGTRSVQKFELGEKYASLAYGSDGFGNDMSTVFFAADEKRRTVSGSAVTDVVFLDERAFLLRDGELLSLSLDGGEDAHRPLSQTYTSLLTAPESAQIVLFSGSEAVILDIDGIGDAAE